GHRARPEHQPETLFPDLPRSDKDRRICGPTRPTSSATTLANVDDAALAIELPTGAGKTVRHGSPRGFGRMYALERGPGDPLARQNCRPPRWQTCRSPQGPQGVGPAHISCVIGTSYQPGAARTAVVQ